MAGCDSLPYTTSYHADLTQNLAGNPVYSPGYASLSGGSKKKGGYPPWFDNVPKNMSRKKYLRNLEEKKRLRELKKKSKGSKRTRKTKTNKRTRKTKTNKRTRKTKTNKRTRTRSRRRKNRNN
jgi:hypothetical protein